MFDFIPLIIIRHELTLPNPNRSSLALTLFQRLNLNNHWTDFDQISVIQLEKSNKFYIQSEF